MHTCACLARISVMRSNQSLPWPDVNILYCSVNICVIICVNICVNICINICVIIYVNICVNICVNIYVNICVNIYVNICVNICVLMYTPLIHILIYTYLSCAVTNPCLGPIHIGMARNAQAMQTQCTHTHTVQCSGGGSWFVCIQCNAHAYNAMHMYKTQLICNAHAFNTMHTH